MEWDPKSWYLLAISVSITNAFMVACPPTLWWERDEEDQRGEGGWGGSPWTCHGTTCWANSDAALRNLESLTGGVSQSAWRRGDALEVLPPRFHGLKCKPVCSGVRKHIELFVPLVPHRARRRLLLFFVLDAVFGHGGHAGRGAGSTQGAQSGRRVLRLRL